MNKDQDTYQLINDYLNGSMTGLEKKAVSDRIQEDSEFAKEYRKQKELNNLVFTNRMKDLKTRMGNDISSMKTAVPKKSSKKKTLILLALLAIIGTGAVIYFNQENNEAPVSDEEVVINNEELDFVDSNETTDDPSNLFSSQTQEEDIVATELTNESLVITENEVITIDSTPNPNLNIQESEITSNNATDTTTNNEPLPDEPDCSVIDISVNSIGSPSCSNDKTGTITFMTSSVKGGKAPYTYAIERKTDALGQAYGFRSNKVINNLPPGSYNIKVKDANGCITQQDKPVEVGEKRCSSTKGLLFSPEKDLTLKFTVRSASSGIITIYNQAKLPVSKINFGESGAPQWTGTNNQGARVPNGLYLYAIDYSGGNTESGQITVY